MSVEDQGHGWSQALGFDLVEKPMGKGYDWFSREVT